MNIPPPKLPQRIDPRQIVFIMAQGIFGKLTLDALGAELVPCMCGCPVGYRVEFRHAVHVVGGQPEIFDPRVRRAESNDKPDGGT